MGAEALLTGAALVATPVRAAHWQAAVARVVHVRAVAGCFGPGGISVATDHTLA